MLDIDFRIQLYIHPMLEKEILWVCYTDTNAFLQTLLIVKMSPALPSNIA